MSGKGKHPLSEEERAKSPTYDVEKGHQPAPVDKAATERRRRIEEMRKAFAERHSRFD